MDNDLINLIDDTTIIQSSRIDSPTQCKSVLDYSGNPFTVLTQNIRSIRKNLLTFYVFLCRLDFLPDIIVFTECRLDENFTTINLPNYDCHHSTNFLNQNDGMIVMSKCGLQISVREPAFDDANCLLLDLCNQISIIAIYRSPSVYNIERFLSSLEKVISMATGPTCVIAGDINLNIIEGNIGSRAHEYLNLITYHGFVSGHGYPTRGPSCLDHALVKTKRMTKVIVCDSDITDHNAVIIGVFEESQYYNAKTKYSNRLNYKALVKDLQSVDWSDIMSEIDVTVVTTTFIKTIQNMIKLHTTKSKIRSAEVLIKPWMTLGLLKCARKRDRLHKEARNNPKNDSIQTKYRNYRNYCNNIIKKLNLVYNKERIEDSKGDNKKLWHTVKDICNIKASSSCNIANTICTNANDSANAANTFFTNVGKNLADDILNRLNTTEEQLAAAIISTSGPLDSLYFSPTDYIEVKKTIAGLKSSYSSGWDGINNIVLKQCKDIVAPILAHICNLSMTSGIFPDCLKMANVCPIYKSGNPLQITNYRPISLLSSVSKILEKIVNKRLLWFLERHGLLANNQYGFRQNRSTEDAVITLVDHITEQVDRGRKCISVFIDLAKAFDTVSRPMLLRKLEALGIRGVALSWFQSYIMNRSQNVTLDNGNVQSERQHLAFGVPQGSVLGPSLFLAYINDLCNLDIDGARVITFADDTALVFNAASWDEVADVTQRGLARVAYWLQRNLLTLNTSKTKYLAFRISERTAPSLSLQVKIHVCRDNSDYKVNCDCAEIEQVQGIKYLGVIIDNHLNWKQQIDKLTSRTRKLMYIFKKLGEIGDTDILKTIYLALCQSVLAYGIISWGSAAKTHLIRLEKAQRAILKVSYKKPYRFPTNALYQETKFLRVRQIFIQQTVMRFHRCALGTLKRSERPARSRRWYIPMTRTRFAEGSFSFLGPFLYQKVDGKLSLFEHNRIICKRKVVLWLQSLDYDNTESFLAVRS